MSEASARQCEKQKGKILVVDDELIVCKSCVRVLAPEGYSVTTTQSGREGIERGASGDFDVAIVDLKMPDMDGMEVLHAIKEKQPEVQVIVITGYSTASTAVDVIKLGAGEYLPKPFTPDELLAAVSRAMKSRRAIAENR